MNLSIRKYVAAFSVMALIASFLVTAGVASAQTATDYDDVNGEEWFVEDVQWGLDNGILDSEQAYFRGGDNATRAEFTKMALLGAGLPEEACDETLFPDLDADHWGCGYVTAAANAGIVSGMGAGHENEGYFLPNDTVLRAEAGKITVEAYGLEGTSLGSDVFTDVPVGEWYDEYMGSSWDNCVFQGVGGGNTVEPGRNIVRAEAIAVVQRGANPTDECHMMAEGALTVTLDGSSPDGVSIPQNGANILYSVFAFSASADEDVNVEQVIISRQGLGLPSDFKNIKLYVDGVQKGGEKTINTTTNSATFNLSSDPIEVPAGKTVLVEARADMNGVSGSENQLCIAMDEDVTGFGADSAAEVEVGGSFAVCGDLFSTTSASVGELTYTVSAPSDADINVGDTDVIMTKVKMDMATEAANVERITFKQVGSADQEDFGNPTLYMSGNPLDVPYSWEGDMLTFDLAADPVNIAKGSTKTVELWIDVTGGLNSTASFDIYRDWHIEGTGEVYGYGVNVIESGTSSSPANRNIVGGNIAFSLSGNNPVPGDVKVGAEDFEFVRFNASTAGDGVTVRKISLTVNSSVADCSRIEDVKIWAKNSSDEWAVVAGPNDITGATCDLTVGPPPGLNTVSYTDYFELPEAETTEYIVTADLTNDAVAGDTYSIDVADVTKSNLTELEYLSDGTPVDEGTEVTGGTLTGNTMTVAEPSYVLTLAATPGDKTYVRNTNDRDLAAFDFNASTADDLRVTGMTVTCTGAPASQCSDAFQSLNLYRKEGSTLTKLDGPDSMTDLGDGDGAVVFSTNEIVEAGNTARFLVRGNIASAAEAATYGFDIAATGDVTAEDTDSRPADDNTAPPYPVGTRFVTVADFGTLANTGVSDLDTKSRILVENSVDETVLKVRFSADELEGWIVKKLQFDELEAPSTTDRDVTNVSITYENKNGDTVTNSQTLSGGTLTFTGMNAYVPAGGNQTLYLAVDTADVSSGNAVAGDIFQMFLNATAPSTYEVVGESSGTQVLAGTDVTGEMMRVAKTAPTVAKLTDVSTTLANGEMTLYKWSVAADDAGDLSLKQVGFETSATGIVANEVGSFKLFRNGVLVSDTTNIDIVDQAGNNLEVVAPGSVPTEVLVQFDSGASGGRDMIVAGASNEYELKATFSNITGGEGWTTTLGNDTGGAAGPIGAAVPGGKILVDGTPSYFVWSDLSVSPNLAVLGLSSTDWLDGWLVDGLSAAGSQVLSKS